MKIERTNVTDQVVAYLKENIQNGSWQVGERIPSENQMTAELGVSRASVRAAIRQLVGIGVLESVHGKGTYLLDDTVRDNVAGENTITAQDCLDMTKVLEFRRIVEPDSCYMATQNRTGELIAELEECLERMRSVSGIDREQFVAADIRFHEAIAHASGNPILSKSLHRVFEETLRHHRKMNTVFGFDSGLYYHAKILERIRRGDRSGAKVIMLEHIQSSLEAVPVEFPGMAQAQ